MSIGEVLSFAGPLVGEAVGLIGSYIASSKEERAAVIARKDAAMAAMREARADEAQAHAERTAETRRILGGPQPTVLVDPDEFTKP